MEIKITIIGGVGKQATTRDFTSLSEAVAYLLDMVKAPALSTEVKKKGLLARLFKLK